MNDKFFFITTYDNISGALLASILNDHPDIHCSVSYTDPFLMDNRLDYIAQGKIIDKFIECNTEAEKQFNGNVQRFSAFELHNKILFEKCKRPLLKVNLTLLPKLRIDLLLKTWLTKYNYPEFALTTIEQRLSDLKQAGHSLFESYIFHYFYGVVLRTAEQLHINLQNAQNKLFIIALAKVITFDSADLPVPGHSFQFEKIVTDEKAFFEFLSYLTANQLAVSEIYQEAVHKKLLTTSSYIQSIQQETWESWQHELLDICLNKRLYTIYYPHIDKSLRTLYEEAGYMFQQEQQQNAYSKLLSIQLNSNRPSQLTIYLDNIEETTDDPNAVEVLVNIDEGDKAMEEVLIKESARRQFIVKYITTPRPKSFCDLWQPINRLLEITDPNAYFLLNISDEMLFATKGWDTVLKKYVGFFPDHIFRLRASRNKFRNYFDRWECSFGQDAIPITTKKWIDIGGDWNPCFGPDSFQQLISFYLAREGKFSSTNYLRELPIIDIKFHGDVPSLGMDRQKAWKHTSDHLKAMQICQSYPMQLEACRRAMLLKAHIIASANQLQQFTIEDKTSKKQLHLIDKQSSQTIATISYKLSWLGITLTNQYRKFQFNAYFGGGKEAKRFFFLGFASYLKAKYALVNKLYHLLRSFPSLTKIKQARLRKNKRNLAEENTRLKELYISICLENEKLQSKKASEITANVTNINQADGFKESINS